MHKKFTRTDYLAVTPGLFMCIITLIMLVMDVAMPEMGQGQYVGYPAVFSFINIQICICGIIYFVISLITRTKNVPNLPGKSNKHIKARKADNFNGQNSSGININLLNSLSNPIRFALFCFMVFTVLMFLSTMVNGFDSKTIHGVSFRNIGIFHIIAFIFIYTGVSSMIQTESFRRMIIVFYIAVADLIAAAVAVDQFISPIAAFREKKDLSAIFFNGNHYGYFLVMAVLLSAGLFLYSADIKIRVFFLISMLVNLAVLSLNGSSGCLLAVAAGFILTIPVTIKIIRDTYREEPDMTSLKSSKTKSATKLSENPLRINIALLAVLGIAFAVLAFKTGMLAQLADDFDQIITGGSKANEAGHNRWLLWTTTWDYITKKPLLGYGCEGLSDVLMETLKRGNPHNEILSYAAQFGIPAAIFYTLGVFFVFADFFIDKTETHSFDETHAACFLAATGYFVSSLFGVPMFYTLPFFFIFMGMSIRAVN